MRIGVDVDGVLAQFNDAYIEKCIEVTGKDLFPPQPFDIITWNYPESFGYSNEDMSAIWNHIKSNPFFWRNLKDYPTTSGDLDALHYRQGCGDEIYFITARPGTYVKQQTEVWIRTHCYNSDYFNATVLISSHKGLCAQALGLDAYIDDRIENVIDVANTKTRTFVMDRPWNRILEYASNTTGLTELAPITRVSSVEQMLALLP